MYLLKTMKKDGFSSVRLYDYSYYIKNPLWLPRDDEKGYFGIYPFCRALLGYLDSELWAIEVDPENVRPALDNSTFHATEKGVANFTTFRFHRKVEEYSLIECSKFIATFIKDHYIELANNDFIEGYNCDHNLLLKFQELYVHKVYPLIISSDNMGMIKNIVEFWYMDPKILTESSEINEFYPRAISVAIQNPASVLSVLGNKNIELHSNMFMQSFIERFNILEYLK